MNFRAVVLRPLDVARDWTQRFVEIQGIDRAMALGAQAYTALIPLLIVYVSLLPRADNEDFADVMIKEFELSGSTAASFKRAFAPAGEVESSVTALGVILLIVSALSFTRGMQRLYEGVVRPRQARRAQHAARAAVAVPGDGVLRGAPARDGPDARRGWTPRRRSRRARCCGWSRPTCCSAAA